VPDPEPGLPAITLVQSVQTMVAAWHGRAVINAAKVSSFGTRNITARAGCTRQNKAKQVVVLFNASEPERVGGQAED